MHLFNSLARIKEPFVIPRDRPVTLYVCGVTPYDTTHIGHARTFLIFDLLVRYLQFQGAAVRYCQNVTDVDDPLFARARRDGLDWRDLSNQQVAQLLEDYRGMNFLPPTYFPRASEEIGTMLPLIERLIALGHAYVVGSEVYFSIRSDPDFGKMARMGYAELLATANQRGNNPDDPNKRDPLDFVLWQRGGPDDPKWESPWGLGRPGWHIECSAMAMRYLGEQLDIHGGGADLIFPHHPCEIAQSEPVTGKRPFVKVWMHAGLVWLDGEKMSKSLGNLVFARDALREYGTNALRWYLLSQHYREDFDYQHAGIAHCRELAQHLAAALAAQSGTQHPLDLSVGRAEFLAAIDDDLNTPAALAVLHTMVGETLAAAAAGRDVGAAVATLREVAGMLGFVVA
ncbi:MAG: cysteine--tRNA ligase [Candidatus Viridilinea halotolerans]|uniref:Cysteine--tRNA ligase n=1 Tax=Candidatus Viridilinea halotolerans TaxID=2491704 RepID=A0A426U2J4_9CHLR|nr:MAG: cysteine--tRNA ligase [Candidatus Viridilinea halotolerans]